MEEESLYERMKKKIFGDDKKDDSGGPGCAKCVSDLKRSGASPEEARSECEMQGQCPKKDKPKPTGSIRADAL